jgi:GNAT superfamily N-acetyltransferase
MPRSPAVEIFPLTPDRFDDLVDLFGPERGGNSGCWCMWWRMPRADWKTTPREEKRDRFRAIVEEGPPPGVLAYDGGTAVGWCAVGPRRSLPQFNRSRVAAPFDEVEGVFAVNCFYIRSGRRGDGLMPALLKEALAFAVGQGAKVIEACPIETERKLIWGEGYVGIASVFREAGFSEVARRSPTRPLMRKTLSQKARRRRTG